MKYISIKINKTEKEYVCPALFVEVFITDVMIWNLSELVTKPDLT